MRLASSLAFAALFLAACMPAHQTFVRTSDVAVAGATHLVVRTDGGDVTVLPAAASGSAMHVEILIRAHSQEEADGIVPTIALVGNEARVVWEGPTPIGDGVSFIVTAPAMLAVDAHTNGGDLDVQSATGDVSASTDGGDIRASGLRGRLTATSDGGDVDVSDFDGTFVLETHGGHIIADGALAGASSARTSGGDVIISIPASSALVVDATTSGGAATNDFGIPVSSDGGDNGFSGTLGDGHQGSLFLHTDGGDVRLARSL